MRPIYVDMRAFGSYVNERIVFDKVKNGLFLITGQTGAGKTTVFDAITYALYGKTSGSMRSEKMIHSNFASPRDIPRVEYKFSYGKDVYTIIRESGGVSYSYDKKTDTWTKNKTSRSEKVQLFLPDGSEFVGKTKETNDEIRRIVKLDVEQFQQVVMLAQGEFTKLIKANSDQRQEILTQIFDSTVYDSIEKNIEGRFKKSYGIISINKEDIQKSLSKINLLENSQYQEQWDSYDVKFSESEPDKLLDLVKSVNDELKAREEVIDQQKESIGKDIKQKEIQLSDAKALNKKFDDLEICRTQLKLHLQKEEKINDLILKNNRASKAKEVDTSYQNYQTLNTQLTSKKVSLEECVQFVDQYSSVLKTLEKTKIAALSAFNENGPKLNISIEKIESSYSQYDEYESLLTIQEKSSKDLIERKKNKELKEISLNSLKEENATLIKIQNELLINRKDPSMYDSRIRLLEDKVTAFNNLKTDVINYQKDLKNLFVLKKMISDKEKMVNSAKEEYDTYYNLFIHDQANLIRSSLNDGDICPVCGNVHHIHDVIDTVHESTDVESLQGLKDTYESLLDELADLKNKQSGMESSLRTNKSSIDRSCEILIGRIIDIEDNDGIHNIKSNVVSIKNEIKDNNNLKIAAEQDNQSILDNNKTLENQKKEIDTLNNELDLVSKDIVRLEQEQLKNNISIETIQKNLLYSSKKEAQIQVKNLKVKYNQLEKAKNDSEKSYNDTLGNLKKESGKKESLEKDIVQLEKDLNQSMTIFILKLKENDFIDEKDYLSSRLDLITITKNQEMVQEYNRKKDNYNTQINMIAADIKDKERVDELSIQNELGKLNEKSKENEVLYKNIVSLLATNEASYMDACSLYEKRALLIKEHITIENLYKVICGKVQKKHLTFKTFILRKYFKQMLKKANERLIVLSNHQFILQCRDIDNLATSGKTGLDIDVYNLVTNKTSDAKALSGGESFITALSMALGMADLIQMNNGSVRIDTMFIDEGFGSLSDEVRNQAVSILQSMTDQNRLIGIISHVTELKNQVDTQLVITKDDKGSHHEWKY